MRARGMKLVQLWLDPREVGLILGAALRARKRLATWVRQAAVHAAERDAAAARKKDRRESREG
jgi:hypothetical protein